MRIAVTLGRQQTSRQKAKQRDYVQSLLNAGARSEEIVEIRPGDVPEGRFDGLLLGGGSDVAPERYGQKRIPNAGLEVDEERDKIDFSLLEKALQDRAPVLGICRGLQVVNVGLGGTLIQDLPTQGSSTVVHDVAGKDRTNRAHSVTVLADSRFATITGASEIDVNSRHHQAVDRLADDFVATATAPDGVVEALEARDGRWLLAVQWHPENLLDDPVSRRLFREFVGEVRKRTGNSEGSR